MAEKNEEKNPFVVYADIIRYLANKSNDLKFDMYASATAHDEITSEKVIGAVNEVRRELGDMINGLI